MAIQARGCGAVVRSRPAIGARRVAAGPGPLRLTSRGRWVLTLLITAVLAAIGLVGTQATADGPARAVRVERYVVQPGDTLWRLAERVAEPGTDVRDVVLELQKLNGMPRAGLTAGQQLILPARD